MADDPRPHVIGVAGPSGAGKTVLARALAARLAHGGTVVPLDAYYHDREDLSAADRAVLNYDHPDALDATLATDQLAALAAGESVARPVYDFVTHRRRAETVTVSPGRFVVVDGLLTFHWETTRELCATRIFVEADDAVCLSRRLTRDATDRGRTAASIRRQWRESVVPMRRRYVDPTRRFAHLVLDGRQPVGHNVDRIMRTYGW